MSKYRQSWLQILTPPVLYRPLIRTFHFSNDRPREGPKTGCLCTPPHGTVFFYPTKHLRGGARKCPPKKGSLPACESTFGLRAPGIDPKILGPRTTASGYYYLGAKNELGGHFFDFSRMKSGLFFGFFPEKHL